MSALLTARCVTLAFGGVKAVDHVDFEIEQGEILGLIGPNGAGKTSLLNCISQVYPLTGGSLLYKDRELKGLSPAAVSRLGIARTFQIVRPFPQLSVRENAAVGAMFGRSGLEVKAAMNKADEVLEFVGLSHLRRANATRIPTADRKRLELARALCMDPELLLLDEVLAGLGTAAIEKVVELIRKVRGLGVTVLMVEHVIRPMMAMADRVLVLHHGRKLALGAPATISHDPEVIRAYLGRRYQKADAVGEPA